jgi:hypothetical protein
MRRAVVAPVLLLALSLTSCGGEHRIQPEVITGITTAVNADATAVGLKDERTGQFIGGYDVGAADGRDCLVPESAGQTISLGVVRTTPTDAHPGADLVGWVECMSPPTRSAP